MTPAPLHLTPAEQALVALGQWLREVGYHFITVTPETHRRVRERPAPAEPSLRDVFGWSRPFRAEHLPLIARERLAAAGALLSSGERGQGWLSSAVRFSSIGERLFVHSAYPTLDDDAVFFGPDTYRYAAFLERELASEPAERAVDVGAGSGAGLLSVAPRVGRVVLSDINGRALSCARVSAALAGVAAEVVHSDVLAAVEGPLDVVAANPPYMADARGRAYRDGGGLLGTGLALRIVREAMARLHPGGRLLLYTGVPMIRGEDPFRAAVAALLEGIATWHYQELDPDVFGEELEQPSYADVERIAAVALVARVAGR